MSVIRLELDVPDEDADPQNKTGLTEEGYERLSNTLALGLGYGIVTGPELVG